MLSCVSTRMRQCVTQLWRERGREREREREKAEAVKCNVQYLCCPLQNSASVYPFLSFSLSLPHSFVLSLNHSFSLTYTNHFTRRGKRLGIEGKESKKTVPPNSLECIRHARDPLNICSPQEPLLSSSHSSANRLLPTTLLPPSRLTPFPALARTQA